MPIYDYTCSVCHQTTEVIHGINDHGPRFCPECGAEGTMTKAFVAPTVHFKGSGWAKKDRSTSARASRAKDEKSDGGGETKPAAASADADKGTAATKPSSGDGGSTESATTGPKD